MFKHLIIVIFIIVLAYASTISGLNRIKSEYDIPKATKNSAMSCNYCVIYLIRRKQDYIYRRTQDVKVNGYLEISNLLSYVPNNYLLKEYHFNISFEYKNSIYRLFTTNGHIKDFIYNYSNDSIIIGPFENNTVLKFLVQGGSYNSDKIVVPIKYREKDKPCKDELLLTYNLYSRINTNYNNYYNYHVLVSVRPYNKFPLYKNSTIKVDIDPYFYDHCDVCNIECPYRSLTAISHSNFTKPKVENDNTYIEMKKIWFVVLIIFVVISIFSILFISSIFILRNRNTGKIQQYIQLYDI